MGLPKAAHRLPLATSAVSCISKVGTSTHFTAVPSHGAGSTIHLLLLGASELSLVLNNQESHPPAHSALRILQPGLGVCTRNDSPVVTRSVSSAQGPSQGLPCPGRHFLLTED